MMTEAKTSLISVILKALAENPEAAILLFLRHATYLTVHVRGQFGSDNEMFAANYSERIDPSMFLLDEAGIQHSRWQGRQFTEAGIDIQRILTSNQGRGADTGIRIAEGFAQAGNKWPSVRSDRRAEYPRYNYDAILAALNENRGDRFVPEWINGQRPGLVRQPAEPRFLCEDTISMVDELLRQKGLSIVTTHFENVTFMRGFYVSGCDLGTIPLDWSPKKSGGVCIIRTSGTPGDDVIFDVNPDLTVG